jgi:subtilase family serine protease
MFATAVIALRSLSVRSVFTNSHKSTAPFTVFAVALFLLLCPTSQKSAAQSASTAGIQALHDHVKIAANGQKAQFLSALPASQKMELAIVLPLRNQDQLDSLLTRLYDPSSADYHKFLSVEEFTEQFGPTEADYQAVLDFAAANGLTVTGRAKNRLIVPVEGSVAQINAAFNVAMGLYQHPTEDRTYFSPDREPSLAESALIAHIDGMNSFSLPRSLVVHPMASQPMVLANGSGPSGSYLGSDMRVAYYGGSTLTGLNQTVAVVEFGGYNKSDVDLSFSGAGQTYSVPLTDVLVGTATNTVYRQQDGEQVLDIVQAIGMAPGLKGVSVYIGSPTSSSAPALVLNQIAADNSAKQIGCSWGWIPDSISTHDGFLKTMAAQGQTFFAASGDDGAFQYSISPYFYPAESQYVTAVGGTHLTVTGPAGAWSAESAWNSNSRGSGGGVSPDGIALPNWQSGLATSANGGSDTYRNVPDVAMEADYDNYMCELGNCYSTGAGTSFAAPRWAGFMALVNQQAVEAGNAPTGGIGFINETLLQIGTGSNYGPDFHDVQTGNNNTANQTTWFSAVSGYDLVTGWGSPTGQTLIDDLAGKAVPGFWISPASGTVTVLAGNSNTATINVTPVGGFTSSVALSITSTLPDGVTASFSPTTTASSSVLTFVVASSTVSGNYLVTVSGTSGSITQSTSLTLVVHGPSFSLTPASTSLSFSQGKSVTDTITVNDLYGFTGNVNLEVSGLPPGVTGSFATNPTGTTSVLTLTASTSAANWTGYVTVTGTSGALTASTTIYVAVVAPTFTLSSSTALSIGQGQTSSTSVYVVPQNGFTGSVTLAVSGLPSGVTAFFTPNPVSSSAQITITASSTAATGTATVTITGTSGATTAKTTITLTVNAPTFTLSGPGSISVGQGSTATGYVYANAHYGFSGSVTLAVTGLPTGVTASFATNPTTYFSQMTISATSSAVAGTYTATITGTAGSITASTAFNVIVGTPSFTISGPGSTTISQGGSRSASVSISSQFGFNGNVTLSASGLPSGVTAAFSTNPTTYSSTLVLTASATAATGSYTVTITGTSGAITKTTTIPLTIVAPSLQVSGGGSVTLGIGSTASAWANVYGNNGYSGSATFSISGLPSGITATFSTNPVTFGSSSGQSQITFTASSTVATGSYTATLTATSGSVTASTSITLVVAVPSFTLSGAASVTVGQGGSNSSYIYVNGSNGFNGNVTFSVSGLPTGVTAAFGTNPASYSTLLTFSATSAAPIGTYTVTVTGTSGTLTASTTISLTIATPSFTLSSGESVTVGQGGSSTTYVYANGSNGFNGNVTLSVNGLPTGVTAAFGTNPTTYYSMLTFTADATTPTGTYTVTLTGTSGSTTASTTISLTVATPSFTLTASSTGFTMSQGASTNGAVYMIGAKGFSGAVSLSVSGLPSGVTVGFGSNPTSSYYTGMTITASSSATPGTSTVTITGTSGSTTASTTMTLTVAGPTFTLSATPGSIYILPGAIATSSVAVTDVLGFTGSVTFSVSGLPAGVTAEWSPSNSSTASVLTLAASSTAALGKTTAIIAGTSGALTVTAKLQVTVLSAANVSTTTLTMTSGGSTASTLAWGNPVTLTAAVTLGSAPVATGVVNFCDSAASYCSDIHLLGTAQLTSAGTASISFVPLPGSHSYKAVFAGTETANSSSSSASTLQVTGTYPTTTTLTSSGTSGNYSLAAQISGAGPQAMTGQVSFVNTSTGNSAVGSANLVAGTPSLTWAQLSSPAAGPAPGLIAAADFNGDGVSDIAVLNANYDAITILLGNADGSFTASSLSPQTASSPTAIITSDFNDDGVVDLAVVNTSGVVNVYLGNGDGTFQALSSFTTTVAAAGSIVSGDLNNDGIADLAITDSTNNNVVILLGKGDGTFAAVSTAATTGSQPGAMAAGDFNNDGNMDIAVANYGGPISLLFGNGDGTFTTASGLTTSANGPRTIIVGDFNRDGKPDLAVSNTYSNFVTIFLGKGDGTFTTSSSPSIPYYSSLMTPIDANQDGFVDFFLGSLYDTSGTILLGNGDGTFTLGSSLTLPSWNTGLASARVTSSGYPAVIATFSNTNNALVLLPYIVESATANVTGIGMGDTGSNLVAASYSGDTNYSASKSNTVTLKGTKNDPIINWAAPAAIGYGTALSSTQLNATANVAGTFTYTPAAGTVLGAGTQTLSVTFTPTDASNYNIVTASVQLVVNKAAPVLTWAAPTAIGYGAALSSTQLNATANVAGTFTYTPAAGTVLGAGTQALSVTFTPTDASNYNTVTASVQLVVNKAVPVLTWAAPAAIGYGTALSSTQLNATASVAGTLVYSPAAGTVLAVGNQTLSVAFTPSDSADYNNATATVVLVVNSLDPVTAVISSLTPAFTSAGNGAFTLTVNGANFASGSTIYVGSTALTTQFVSATQLTGSVPATLVASAGTVSVTVQLPASSGTVSNAEIFEIDTAGSAAGTPTFTTLTATVTAGSQATYALTLPASATFVFVNCLNLPAGANCSYSASTGTLTINSPSTTPSGTYQIVVVFTETLPGTATGFILMPFLLVPLWFLRRRPVFRNAWATLALVVALVTLATTIGCGGGSSGSNSTTPTTHQITSSAALTLIVR